MESVIFAPTASGRPHIGTACNMLACDEIAKLRGARLIRRMDYRDEPQRRLSSMQKRESEKAIDRVAALLGIEFTETYTSDDRRGRYMRVICEMVANGSARQVKDGDVELHSAMRGSDMVHGPIREYCCNLLFDNQPYSTVVAVVDAMDFNERIHPRGNDLIADMIPECVLWGYLAPARPPLRYAHFPIIADEFGQPFHKSGKSNDALHFLMRWPTTEARRARLMKYLMCPGVDSFSFSLARRDYMIHIDPAGAIAGSTPWPEMGIFG